MKNTYFRAFFIGQVLNFITLAEKKKVRFYPNLVTEVVKALHMIFHFKKQSDQIVRSVLLEQKKWGSRDRRFVSSTVYDMVRNYRLLYEVAGKEPKKASEWWKLFAIFQIAQGNELPDWKEFEKLDVDTTKQKIKEVNENPNIRESFPDWIADKGRAAYAGQWNGLMIELNQPAALVIRVNTLKTDAAQLRRALDKVEIKSKILSGDALLIPERKRMTHLSVFRKGWFEIQDLSSQLVAPLMDVSPGMTVIDACAGAGGKALHLAALMKNKGKIIAMDISKKKLHELEKRAKRAGITIIETYLIHPKETFSAYKGVGDRILLDVPCSGTGTIRRSPDIKWKLQESHIEKHKLLQKEILDSYTEMLKIDGQFVYATCSIFPEENTQQVHQFIDRNPKFSLNEEKQIKPMNGHDGFYVANIQKGS